MCLLLIAVDAVPRAPLLLLGNRDEFHERPSAPAQPWSENAAVAGGRDLVAGGAWFAVRADGRFAVVTNLRTGVPATAPRSRGALVRDFVLSDADPAGVLAALARDAAEYGPFNLVAGDRAGAYALGGADRRVRPLGPGVHVVSNGPIGVHWPKTERLRRRFLRLLEAAGAAPPPEPALLDLLLDEAQPPDAALPDTGVGRALERVLAPVFIRGARYGTRASTLALRRDGGEVALRERRFGPDGAAAGESRWAAAAGQGFAGTALA